MPLIAADHSLLGAWRYLSILIIPLHHISLWLTHGQIFKNRYLCFYILGYLFFAATLKFFTKRRAPVPPDEFVGAINQTVAGWVNYFAHTNASEAFRTLQRFINIRFRRYLTFRSKGRGFGWKKYPNKRLYAMGIIYIGSGRIRYPEAPAHAL